VNPDRRDVESVPSRSAGFRPAEFGSRSERATRRDQGRVSVLKVLEVLEVLKVRC
jgi:hypothetical protein